MHTVTVLQYWHIPLTAVSYVLSLGIPMAEKKKTHRKITLLHMGIMLSGVTVGIAGFFGIPGE